MTEQSKIANPAPLGLLGFGLTTLLLNLHNAGIMQLDAVTIAMGFALGGLCQLIAGIMEFKTGNTFGATAFCAYGGFWWSLIIIWAHPFEQFEVSMQSMGFYLLLWGIFTLFMFIGTLKQSRANRVVFFTLTLLFFLLAITDFTGNETIGMIAGYVGIFCGASALYNSFGQILNETYGKTLLPL